MRSILRQRFLHVLQKYVGSSNYVRGEITTRSPSKKITKGWYIFLLLALQVPSCKKDDTSVNPQPPVEPKLSSIQAQIFDVNGCSTTTCHGASASGGLKLTTGVSFAQLVDVPSTNDGDHQPPFVRVKPGVPDSSFLVIKLTAPSPRQGSLMPRVGSKLSDDKINAIRTWILNGAQNN
ncbi:MAG: hypothetical protein HYR76_00220 [Ignavibacteria bacterium]|nr:hypothetical protein [Ignavibacteria bacterium]MBI3766266.1 hypothetical protein [Ignavibacteriales bacterium]